MESVYFIGANNSVKKNKNGTLKNFRVYFFYY